MALPFYVTVEGKLQGKFKGSSTHEGHPGAIVGLAFLYELTMPRAPSGQATGKRQHGAITVTKAWDAATPQLLTALIENEVLRNVTFEFARAADDGLEEVYHTITLSNARISAVRQHVSGAGIAGAGQGEYEDVSFVFSRIEVRNLPEGTVADDDLSLPV